MSKWFAVNWLKLNLDKTNIIKSMLGGSPCHHSMARPRADGRDSLQFWRLAANILNKQSRTNDKRWSSSLGGWAWG
jgi:hypothetical protein